MGQYKRKKDYLFIFFNWYKYVGKKKTKKIIHYIIDFGVALLMFATLLILPFIFL